MLANGVGPDEEHGQRDADTRSHSQGQQARLFPERGRGEPDDPAQNDEVQGRDQQDNVTGKGGNQVGLLQEGTSTFRIAEDCLSY